MNAIKGYRISEDTIEVWIQKFVPQMDFFYFQDSPSFIETRPLIEINTREEFTLDQRTSYTTWAIHSDAKFLAVIESREFHLLKEEDQVFIMKEQWRLGRGLMLAETFVKSMLKGLTSNELQRSLQILKDYSFQDIDTSERVYMLHYSIWQKLNINAKTQFLLNYANEWVHQEALWNTIGEEEKREIGNEFPKILSFIDSFPDENGPNCFATALLGATGESQYLLEWMQPNRFLQLLEKSEYKKLESVEFQKEDILVWYEAGVPVHGSFVLNNKYCFNKQGQTMFNPWQIIEVEDLLESWNEQSLKLEILRK